MRMVVSHSEALSILDPGGIAYGNASSCIAWHCPLTCHSNCVGQRYYSPP